MSAPRRLLLSEAQRVELVWVRYHHKKSHAPRSRGSGGGHADERV